MTVLNLQVCLSEFSNSGRTPPTQSARLRSLQIADGYICIAFIAWQNNFGRVKRVGGSGGPNLLLYFGLRCTFLLDYGFFSTWLGLVDCGQQMIAYALHLVHVSLEGGARPQLRQCRSSAHRIGDFAKNWRHCRRICLNWRLLNRICLNRRCVYRPIHFSWINCYQMRLYWCLWMTVNNPNVVVQCQNTFFSLLNWKLK